jgi:hypothetical protein
MLWEANVGSKHLEAKTREVVLIMGCQEFGELEGLIIYTSPYGLLFSLLCCNQWSAGILYSMGF